MEIMKPLLRPLTIGGLLAAEAIAASDHGPAYTHQPHGNETRHECGQFDQARIVVAESTISGVRGTSDLLVHLPPDGHFRIVGWW